MEISGQRLFFPSNFRFFHRLPARFEILVISRGAEKQGAPVFEIEIAGQRLALPSRVPLVVGQRYELEKISQLEFKIVREKNLPDTDAPKTADAPRTAESAGNGDTVLFNLPVMAKWNDLLLVRLLEEEGHALQVRGEKYLFDFGASFPLRGLFHRAKDGTYTLLVTGHAADPEFLAHVDGLLSELGIKSVRQVNTAVFDQLANGAVDLTR